MGNSRGGTMQVVMEGDVARRAGARCYEVVAISAGEGNGLRYSAGVLEEAVALFEGASVFVDHSQLGERFSETGGRSVRNVLGVLEHVWYGTSPPAPLLSREDASGEGSDTSPPAPLLSREDASGEGRRTSPPATLATRTEAYAEAGGAICGELRVYPGPDADWFCAMVDQYLVDQSEGRATPRIGLSAVLDVAVRGQEVVEIKNVVSVDAVFDPARGGEFIRALNQATGDRQPVTGNRSPVTGAEEVAKSAEGGQQMAEEIVGSEQLAVGLAEKRRDFGLAEKRRDFGLAEKRRDSNGEGLPVAGQQLPVTGDRVPVTLAETQGGGNGGVAASGAVEPPRVLVAEPQQVGEVGVALSEMVLEGRLARTQLPAAMLDLLRTRFGGRVFRPADLDREVEALQSAWAAAVAAEGPQVRGVGTRVTGDGSRVSGVINEVDRAQALMDQLVGLRPASEALAGLRPVSGIRELYLMLTGDYDFRGVFDKERVALANVTTATMTSLVKNAFNKVILDYFNSVDRWWESIVSQESFGSMQDLTLITLGGFGDLPTVAEGAAYTELSWSDSEEVVSFVKKGGYVGVTLEMMDKDETRTFRAIPRRLAIAGYRTLSAMIANLWTANSGVGAYWPSSQSTYRLFDAAYGNLGTSALSASAWDAVIQAMYKQTEATSGERMGIRPAYLVVPIELEKTALTIMDSAGEPGTADNDANVRRGSSRVIVCPEMTDTNDWLAVADPRVWPAIMVGYRFGSTPEVFIADQETVGSMFTNDEMRIKARFIVAVGVGDYRPLYKCNVS